MSVTLLRLKTEPEQVKLYRRTVVINILDYCVAVRTVNLSITVNTGSPSLKSDYQISL